jgi:hypothetical protein
VIRPAVRRRRPGLGLAGAVLVALAAPAAAQDAAPTKPALDVVRLNGPTDTLGRADPHAGPTPVPTTGPTPAAPARGGSAGLRIVLAFLAEIAEQGDALLGSGIYVRARELDLEERRLALREREADRQS